MRLDMSNCRGFSAHRHGWGFVIDSIKFLHSSSGVILDDFIERTFSWDYYKIFMGNYCHLPYSIPWIGIIHNPPNHPKWFDYENSVDEIFKRPVFQESLRSCLAIFTLSEYLAEDIRRRVPETVKVFSVLHPTELDVPQWEPAAFTDHRRVVQVGYWLRKMEAITRVSRPDYERVWLPSDFDHAMLKCRMEENVRGVHYEDSVRTWAGVKIEKFLSNADYDKIMQSSVILCDLYDASANNAVIESIARSSPIAVPKLPAVMEYLGKDYPLYIEDDINKCLDVERVFAAHDYLKTMDKTHISSKNFIKGFTTCLQSLHC